MDKGAENEDGLMVSTGAGDLISILETAAAADADWKLGSAPPILATPSPPVDVATTEDTVDGEVLGLTERRPSTQ